MKRQNSGRPDIKRPVGNRHGDECSKTEEGCLAARHPRCLQGKRVGDAEPGPIVPDTHGDAGID
jgi:hypothetical protein